MTTLRVLISGHPVLSSSPKLPHITGEVGRIAASGRIPKQNGWLLAVVHTTRALDTTLGEIVKIKGWANNNNHSLGGYLGLLHVNSILSQQEKDDYNKEIVWKRNMYMHEAGAMPSQLDADKILSGMHSCASTVLARL
ncbi:hypothetical protein Q2K19_21880 [Micromonospora soli]|uniref:hypothetical protein n=1 Tax=Micromonospora sp. NBRC 110009 TaxID=3061627 RepID=UPI002670E0F5|nr:hypothetical protein [Micromonospora sp. NBRC 110009]WKT96834.1 hypothetical protein Q2K19_21880 [Micromonospora sp. NBRC 110009]